MSTLIVTNIETQNAQAQNINGGQLAGMRNKIINGKMEIAQRGTSFAATVGGAYTLDRWSWNNSTSAVVTVSQQADVPSSNEFQSSLRVAVTTAIAGGAGANAANIRQRVEGFNARDLIGRTFTLSFWVRSSKIGVHCVAFKSANGDRSYVAEYTVNVANTWEYKTITVSGGLITTGTWNWTNGVGLELDWTLCLTTGQTTTAGAWQTGLFRSTINQVNVLDTVGNIFAITGVQLEVGEVATPFEHRPYATELHLCRWYTRVIRNAVVTGFGTTIAIYSSGSDPMRALPSTTLVTAGQLVGNGGSTSVTSINIAGGSGDSFFFDVNVASGLVANGSYNYRNGVILLSAEL